jgi:hypothetical protein
VIASRRLSKSWLAGIIAVPGSFPGDWWTAIGRTDYSQIGQD